MQMSYSKTFANSPIANKWSNNKLSKKWLSIVWKTLKLTRYQSKQFSFITFQEQRQKLTHSTSLHASRSYSFKAQNCFGPWKNSPFPLAQGIQLHVRALDLIPCLIPCHRCETRCKRISPNSQFRSGNVTTSPFWSGNVTTSTRGPLTCVSIRADIWRQDGAICSKNRKIVPYHRCVRILRLTVSIPDYRSCSFSVLTEPGS